MPYIIGDKKLILVEGVDIARRSERTEAGVKKRSFFEVVTRGQLIAWKGSPSSSGTWWTGAGYPPDEDIPAESRLAAILTKQAALQQVLCGEHVEHQVQPFDGSPPLRFVPRVSTVNFPAGNWFERSEFTITSECDYLMMGDQRIDCGTSSLGPDGKPLVDEETWSLEQADELGRTYRLTHSVMAQRNGDLDPLGNVTPSGWWFAEEAVQAHLGFNPVHLYAEGVLNLAGWQPYNHARSRTVDTTSHRVSVQESWLCFNPTDVVGNGIPAIDEFTVDVRTSAQDGLISVSVQGSIEGLHIRDTGTMVITTSKWTNALAKWQAVSASLYDRALAHADVPVSPTPQTTSRSFNPIQGRINYAYEFTSRAEPPFPDVVAASTTIDDDYQADVYAALGVLVRPVGPILQNIGSKTLALRTVTVELVLRPSAIAPIDAVASYILGFAPVANQVFIDRNRGSWSIDQGRYMRSITFAYGN